MSIAPDVDKMPTEKPRRTQAFLETIRSRALPVDDPAPLGRDTVDGDAWVAKLNRIIGLGHYDYAHYEAMKYAHAVVKAVGMMLPEDADNRDWGYRYFQVDSNNWREVLELHDFPTPDNLLSALVTRKGPDFVIHEDVGDFTIHDEGGDAPTTTPDPPKAKKRATGPKPAKTPGFVIHE